MMHVAQDQPSIKYHDYIETLNQHEVGFDMK